MRGLVNLAGRATAGGRRVEQWPLGSARVSADCGSGADC